MITFLKLFVNTIKSLFSRWRFCVF